MKTLSTREVNENVSRALQEAREEPVLVRRGDQPAVWMVSADAVARAAGDESIYRQVLELVAVDLFDRGTLTMGQAARLLGLPVGAFIKLCDRLGIPVLRESGRSVREQVDSFERWLAGVDGSGEG
jgi:hypothetical protein